MFKKDSTVSVAQPRYPVKESSGLERSTHFEVDGNYLPPANLDHVREPPQRENLANMSTLKFMQDQLMGEIVDLEALLKQVLDLAEDGIIILNSDLCPVYWNAKAEEMGLSMDQEPIRASPLDKYLSGPFPDLIEKFIKIKISRSPVNDSPESDNHSTVFNISGNPKLKVQIDRLVMRPRSPENANSSYLLLTFREPEKGIRSDSPAVQEETFLTLRESEVLHFIRQGFTNKEIGKKLCVSLPTVATHVRHIFKKMGISSRTKLICQMESRSDLFSRLET
jgi:DNA-binding CsgD family transcriptional regulator